MALAVRFSGLSQTRSCQRRPAISFFIHSRPSVKAFFPMASDNFLRRKIYVCVLVMRLGRVSVYLYAPIPLRPDPWPLVPLR